MVLQQANATQPGTMTGSIIGVETQQQPAGKDTLVNVEQLNMWCADGMRRVKLSELQRVRFLNPIMDNEVRKALETLTLSHDTQKKAVSLSFVGEGKRNVRRRLRHREPDLEDELPAGSGQGEGGQAVPAGLGRGGERHRRGLEGRANGPGQRPAHLLPNGPVYAAVRAAADGRARAVRLPAARHLQRRPQRAASDRRCCRPLRCDCAKPKTKPRKAWPGRTRARISPLAGPIAGRLSSPRSSQQVAGREDGPGRRRAFRRWRRRRSWATSSSTPSTSR